MDDPAFAPFPPGDEAYLRDAVNRMHKRAKNATRGRGRGVGIGTGIGGGAVPAVLDPDLLNDGDTRFGQSQQYFGASQDPFDQPDCFTEQIQDLLALPPP